MQLFAYFWLFLILYFDVITDYNKWVKDIPVKHTKEAIIRIILLTPSVLSLLCPLNFNGMGDFLLRLIIVYGAILSIYWEFFDGFYNNIRGFKWRFNGSVDEDDSFLDKFLYKIGDFWEGVLKWILIIFFNYEYWRN